MYKGLLNLTAKAEGLQVAKPAFLSVCRGRCQILTVSCETGK